MSIFTDVCSGAGLCGSLAAMAGPPGVWESRSVFVGGAMRRALRACLVVPGIWPPLIVQKSTLRVSRSWKPAPDERHPLPNGLQAAGAHRHDLVAQAIGAATRGFVALGELRQFATSTPWPMNFTSQNDLLMRLHRGPTFSQQIKSLEASMGTPLFVRDHRHVELTTTRQILLPDAREILRAHRTRATPARGRRQAPSVSATSAGSPISSPLRRTWTSASTNGSCRVTFRSRASSTAGSTPLLRGPDRATSGWTSGWFGPSH